MKELYEIPQTAKGHLLLVEHSFCFRVRQMVEPDIEPEYSSSQLQRRSRSRTNTEKGEAGLTNGDHDEDSDLDSTTPHPVQQERTRQKKFIKHFKHLQNETVYERK